MLAESGDALTTLTDAGDSLLELRDRDRGTGIGDAARDTTRHTQNRHAHSLTSTTSLYSDHVRQRHCETVPSFWRREMIRQCSWWNVATTRRRLHWATFIHSLRKQLNYNSTKILAVNEQFRK